MLFKKVLIANRGEIAVRVIRTLKEMSIRSVAIYSEADSQSLHRFLADEAYPLKGVEAKDTYLNIEAIIRVAKKCEAEAIHPGYGFLSQNPKFVKRVEEEDIVFIGPSARIHEFAGDKVGARKKVKEEGFPIVPGTLDPLSGVDEVVEAAEKIGYPVILKPVFGGGGVGMKVFYSPEEIVEGISQLQKLAKSAFGESLVYVERYFPEARHIEVQILGERKGRVLHLFERECSVQRRFQKVIEEAPSPALDEETREKLFETAVGIARSIGYVNAGTVEFIYVPSLKQFFFIELNSRIQVEHPITEMITGVDIVREQINIAYYGTTSLPDEITRRGHAFEARIYAEDPLNNFAPSPGKITQYLPPSGPGVRVDGYAYPGYEIPPFYDPLIAKLIVWDENRDKAIKRMLRALDEFVVKGIATNIPLHKAVFKNSSFVKGDYNTRFLEKSGVLEVLKEEKGVDIPEPVIEKKEVKIKSVNVWKLSARLNFLR